MASVPIQIMDYTMHLDSTENVLYSETLNKKL